MPYNKVSSSFLLYLSKTLFFAVFLTLAAGQIKITRDQNGVPDVICDTLNVLGATYANCDGRYKVTADIVDWAPQRPVYKHVSKDRYIFWNAHGLGWSIGKEEYLKSGSHWHRSKLNTMDDLWRRLAINPLENLHFCNWHFINAHIIY